MTYDPFDIVVVPFPFTDSFRTKHRPALVLSQKSKFGDLIEHSVLAMITSEKNDSWPLDSKITGRKQSGLSAPSVIRMKLFTLDNRLILRKTGHLTSSDKNQVKNSLSKLFNYL